MSRKNSARSTRAKEKEKGATAFDRMLADEKRGMTTEKTQKTWNHRLKKHGLDVNQGKQKNGRTVSHAESMQKFESFTPEMERRKVLIESVRHTAAQLAKWGISWPPEKGWKKRLIRNGFPGESELVEQAKSSSKTTSKKPTRQRAKSSKLPTYTEDTLPPFSERAGVYHCQGSSVHPDDLEGGDWEPPFDVVDEVTAEFIQIIRGMTWNR